MREFVEFYLTKGASLVSEVKNVPLAVPMAKRSLPKSPNASPDFARAAAPSPSSPPDLQRRVRCGFTQFAPGASRSVRSLSVCHVVRTDIVPAYAKLATHAVAKRTFVAFFTIGYEYHRR